MFLRDEKEVVVGAQRDDSRFVRPGPVFDSGLQFAEETRG
jgi:hypothetical protein